MLVNPDTCATPYEQLKDTRQQIHKYMHGNSYRFRYKYIYKDVQR